MDPQLAAPQEQPLPAPRNAGFAGARVCLLLLGLGGLGFGVSSAWSQHQQGHTLSPLATLAGALGLFVLLAAAALAPDRVARIARAPGMLRPGGLFAFALVSFTLFFVFGLGALLDTAMTLEELASGRSLSATQDVSRAGLLISLGINFLLFTVPVLLWASFAELRKGKEAFRWAGLTRHGTPASVLWALVSVALVFWVLIAAGLLSHAFGSGDVQNDRAEAIAEQLDVPTALLVAALTGIGEELFFRGFLLKKLGNGPQAVLFGLAHLNYVQVLEVTITAAMGYLFGRTVKRTGSVVGPILGHATFNAISLLIILYKGSTGFPAWLAWLPLRPF
ncbi:MAG: CPBP family intramembrane metalloprotease [Halobacteriales archaeon]|nr:CPBP family intramembrane metalloprotease [Halobacteriales archaeon]